MSDKQSPGVVEAKIGCEPWRVWHDNQRHENRVVIVSDDALPSSGPVRVVLDESLCIVSADDLAYGLDNVQPRSPQWPGWEAFARLRDAVRLAAAPPNKTGDN